MAFGGNDWLSQTVEEIVSPNIPICDPHHHLWDKRKSRIPYQRYLLDELLEDINSGHNVRSTVFIEAESMLRVSGPGEMKSVGEVEFVQGTSAMSSSGLYGDVKVAASIIGSADLNLGEGVRPVLIALQEASPNRFRGIRHRLTWDPHPELAVSSSRGGGAQMQTDQFRTGAKVLADMEMSLEGWMYHHQLTELADLASAIPDLTIILNHIGGLLRTGPYLGKDAETISTWKEGIAAVAACPNIIVKLGGMGMPMMGFDWHAREVPIGSDELATEMEPFISYCIDHFGPDRCMFESNFPVDKVSFSYQVMYNAFKKITSDFDQSAIKSMFHDTAARVYKLSTP
jgi:predicted TIM-barrel fold metal-dependent hydrolase